MPTRVYTDDLVLFTQHLGSAVRAGVPLHQTVELLGGEMVGRGFRKILSAVAQDLKTGASLTEAFSKYPNVFPSYYLRVLHAGEEAGTLAETLQQLSDLLQKNFLIGQRIRRVFAYPIAVLILLIGLAAGAAVFVLPPMIAIYQEMHAEIPGGLIFLASEGYKVLSIVVIIAVCAFWLARRFARAGWCGLAFDWFDLNCPFLGVFTRYSVASRLTRALGTMLRNGIPLPEAMSLCGQMLDNKNAQKSIEAVRVNVEKGETLATSMLGESLFPPTLIWMLSAAEVKGDFLGTLDHLADFYSTKVEQTILWTMEILEPILILLVGGVLVILAFGLYSPIFGLVNAVGGPFNSVGGR